LLRCEQDIHPHIDRIAAEGKCFSDAHAASALCTPSRYSVLTGQLYNLHEDIAEKNNLWLEEPEIVQALKEALIDIIEQES
jgi:arylsulfatase A